VSQASPPYKALHTSWCHCCFWFLSGKSSWVPSRTQGLFPPIAGSRFVLVATGIVFVMWVWRLDHMGMVSVVSLLVCFCRMWLCTGSIWFQMISKIMLIPLNYLYSDVWELLTNCCNKCRLMLNHYDLGCSWFVLKSLVISWTTGVIWAQVWEFDRFGDCFWTCALIIWTVPLQLVSEQDSIVKHVIYVFK
jgi:hypothetical protein